MKSSKTSIHSGNKSEKLSLGKVLKRDFVRLLWTIVYVVVILISAMFIVSIMPTLFAYLYSACGNIIGIDFTKATNADLAFWVMCSLSTGSIIIVFTISWIKKLLTKWTNVIINKHVVIKSEKDCVS